MKKFFAIAAVVAVALTSCVKNEVITPNEEINFKAVNYKNTKAYKYGPIDNTTYPIEEHFGVFAFPEDLTGHKYMNNVEVQYDGSEYWKHATQSYYWPKDGKSLDFVCYSPFYATGVDATYDKGVAFTNFTTTNDLDQQVDLMATSVIEDKTSGPVQVKFAHLLSQIKFNVAPKEVYHIIGITVKDITFTVKSEGDYAQPGTTIVWNGWSGLANDLAYDVVDTDKKIVHTSTATQPVGTPVIIIPQNQVEITVNYEIDYDGTYKEQCNATYTPATQWQMNKIYTYNITIGLDEIKFKPEVVEWAPGAVETFNANN